VKGAPLGDGPLQKNEERPAAQALSKNAESSVEAISRDVTAALVEWFRSNIKPNDPARSGEALTGPGGPNLSK